MTKERNMKKLTILLAVTYLCLVNKAVIANENCDSTQSYSHYCQNRIENLQTLNHQFNKAYSSGSVVNISQPPLVVMPEIEMTVPVEINSTEKSTLRPKSVSRTKRNPKQQLDKNYFEKIVDALDLTGKKHLNQCITRISENKLKSYYPTFSNEIDSLIQIALKDTTKSNILGSLLSRKPSHRDCFKYLDFIFMIS